MEKSWYQSKTKVGAGLGAVGGIWEASAPGIIPTVVTAVGIATLIWGIRDTPLVNGEE